MKLIAGMATTKDRDKYAEIAVKSLYDAGIDKVHVWNNDRQSMNLADNGKFAFLDRYKEPVIYFSVDDDIFYTPDYVKLMVNSVMRYESIVTIHGRKLLGEGINYYKGHKGYRCLGEEKETVKIDVAGTGVTAFNTEYFNPIEIYKAKDLRMSDIIFSLEAAKQDKDIIMIKHPRGIVRDLRVPKGLTIYHNESKNCTRQNELADEIYRIKRSSKKA